MPITNQIDIDTIQEQGRSKEKWEERRWLEEHPQPIKEGIDLLNRLAKLLREPRILKAFINSSPIRKKNLIHRIKSVMAILQNYLDALEVVPREERPWQRKK